MGRERQEVQGDRGGRGVRHVSTGGRSDRAFQLLLGGARAARRPAHAAGRRHARQRGGGTAALPHPAARADTQARVEPRHRAADRFLPGLAGSARRRLRQRLQAAVGAVSQARRRRRRLPLEPARRRTGRPARRAGAAELAAQEVARRAVAEAMKRDTILTIKLPAAGGTLEDYAVRQPKSFRRPSEPFTRRALAAAHVVADPLSSRAPWLEPAIDWDATIVYRKHLWSWGLGIAEAMDTAQRGMGLDWPRSEERRVGKECR